MMARPAAPDRSNVLSDAPSDVQVTITVRPRPGRHTRPEQLAAALVARPRTTLALVIAIAAVAAITAVALHAGRPVGRGARAVSDQGVHLAGIGAAYGYRLRCPNATVPASNRVYASVHIDHHPGCSR